MNVNVCRCTSRRNPQSRDIGSPPSLNCLKWVIEIEASTRKSFYTSCPSSMLHSDA